MLAKWFRLNRWIRAAILYPVLVAVVFVLNIAFHTPILPIVIILPFIMILPSFIPNHPQEEDPDARKEEDPGA